MPGLLQAVGHRGERGISMTIRHYERSYATARSVLGFLEVVGWITVAIGVLIALIGFGTGGLLGTMYRDPPFSARLISAIPGVVTFVGGLISVCYVQVSRAHVDTAEMTREMLLLARKESGGSAGIHSRKNGVSKTPAGENIEEQEDNSPSDKAIELNEKNRSSGYYGSFVTYRDARIISYMGIYAAGGKLVQTIEEAEKFIDDELM